MMNVNCVEQDKRNNICLQNVSICVQIFWNLFTSWWNSCNSPKVALTNKDKIYAYHPEERSFRVLNLCLIVAGYYIYIAAKEIGI